MMIPFLKCPFVPTFLLIKARRCEQKMETFSLKEPFAWEFLGGLSLHLNHLIESCVTNYDWPFGTLPFGLFGSNLDTRGP